MIRDLLYADKLVKITNACAIIFQLSYITFNLIMLIFFSKTFLAKALKAFTIISFLTLYFAINFSLYNYARRKEKREFEESLNETYFFLRMWHKK